MVSSSYETDGFLVVRGALSSDECEKLDAFLTRFPLETRLDWGVRFAKNCIAKCPELGDLITQSSVGKFSSSRFLYDEVVETLNTATDPYPIHQDASYFPAASVSLALALSPLQDARGGLCVAPGSHSSGLRPVEGRKVESTLENDQGGLELLDLQRGDVVIIHPHLVHTMVRNSTALPARMFSVILG